MHTCTYLYICIHIYIYMYVCIYVYICVYVCIYVCIYAYMCSMFHIFIYVIMDICICIYVYIYICLYLYAYLCIYIYLCRLRAVARFQSKLTIPFCRDLFEDLKKAQRRAGYDLEVDNIYIYLYICTSNMSTSFFLDQLIKPWEGSEPPTHPP